jgi:hypothetical protein
MARIRERWIGLWFEPAPAERLGMSRVLFFGALFLFYVRQDFSNWGDVSSAFLTRVWLFDVLHLPLFSKDSLVILQFIWKLSLAFSCIGLLTRFSTATAFLLGLYFLGLPNNFGKVHHYDQPLVFILGLMAFSRCGDSRSVDGFVASRRGPRTAARPPPSGEYTWPIRLVWLILALVFFAAGASKIRQSGLEWVASDNLATLLIQAHYHFTNSDPLVPWSLQLARYESICQSLAALTILLEVGYPLVLVSRVARWVWPPGTCLMLIGIRVLMGPNFEPFLICSLFWVPWDRVEVRLTDRFRARLGTTRRNDVTGSRSARGGCPARARGAEPDRHLVPTIGDRH